jgi:hypothetical protein
MATTKKDLYVGTDKHRWWKEAVVYQVRLFVKKHIRNYLTYCSDLSCIIPRYKRGRMGRRTWNNPKARLSEGPGRRCDMGLTNLQVPPSRHGL